MPGSTVNCLLMESGILRDPMPTSGSAKAMSAWKELSITEGPKKPNWVPGNLGQSDRYGKWMTMSFTLFHLVSQFFSHFGTHHHAPSPIWQVQKARNPPSAPEPVRSVHAWTYRAKCWHHDTYRHITTMHRQRLHLANTTEASLQRQSALHTKRVHQIDVDLRNLEESESEKSKRGKRKLVTIFDTWFHQST